MTGRQWLGALLLSLPFLAVFGFMARMAAEDFGWRRTLLGILVFLLVFTVVGEGVNLLTPTGGR